MPRILFIFLDGVGLGPSGPHNPLSEHRLPGFEGLAGNQPWSADARPVETNTHLFRPIDARLGVEGLPQSGTGQATLFTGVNCAEVVGRHFGPYPHSETHEVIARYNIFSRILGHDRTAAFANAYPPIFFDESRRRNRWTVTTLSCSEAGIPIRDVDALKNGRGIAADLTGRAWREKLDVDIPLRTEKDAARRLHEIHLDHDFTLFEYYLTDKAGHGRVREPTAIVQGLNRFFSALLDIVEPRRSLLLVTSDHGNIEDLSIKTHTLNPVPLIAYGTGAHHFAGVKDLTGVTPASINALT